MNGFWKLTVGIAAITGVVAVLLLGRTYGERTGAEQIAEEFSQEMDDFLKLDRQVPVVREKWPSENTPLALCDLPEEYRKMTSVFYASSSDVPYGELNLDTLFKYLAAKQAYERKDCTCEGKLVPWADVVALFDEIEARVGKGNMDWQATQEQYGKFIEYQAQLHFACSGAF